MTLVNEPLCMVEATSFSSKRAAANVQQQTCSSKRATHTKALFALGHLYFDSVMDLTAKPLPIDNTRHHSSSPPR
ncbi:hypothetical protein EGC77_19245 [Shewanella psychromarinicola]|nr:hypothetical protein EGC77_19245 [Shewanella psychromarinicola]